ncbi:MAG: WD40 repeat domain-containing serine/threonine protein kinase, partial [Limisphaerales bacterium]
MGVVYRARQRSLDREVAVKVLRDQVLASAEERRRFRSEAEAIAKLDHPRIVAIHQVGEDEGQPYFTMDYVEGGNLAERTRNGPLPAREAALLAVQIADAVRHAHARGILHRDLKPSNVLIDADGNACVTDFGLARPLGEGSSLTLTGQVLGTPGYMPPEQAAGHKSLGPAADIYALGALLYHLLTGRPPFAGASVSETLRQVVEQEPVSPRLLNAEVPVDLASVCLRCLAKNERNRYASASAFSEDLQCFLRGEPTLARPAGPTERCIRWIQRKPALAGLAFLAGVLGLLGFAGITWQWRRAEASRERAEASALTARHQLYATDMLGIQQALDLGNTGRAVDQLLAYEPSPGEPDFRGWEWWFFAKRCLSWIETHADRLSTNSPPPIVETDLPVEPVVGAQTPPVFSPDSSLVAYADARGLVNLWDRSRREVVLRLPAGLNPLGFSEDGSILITAAIPTPLPLEAGPFGGLEFWDVRSGSRLRAWSPETTNEIVSAACLSTDGRWLATGDPAGKLRLRSVDDGLSVRELSPANQRVWSLAFSPDNRVLAITLESELWFQRLDRQQIVKKRGSSTPVAFSPDGRLVAAGNFRQIRIYDVDSGKPLHGFFSDLPVWMAFSKDGQTLACADGGVSLWNVATERRLATLLPRSGAEFVRFSPDGSTLIGGRRGEIHLWDAASPREIERLFNSSVPSYSATLPPRDPSRVPPRAADTLRRLIDLTGYYVASLDDNWGGSPGDNDNSLRELPSGVRTLAGVPFDIRGILQLGSLHGYPRRIRGIPIGMKCVALHFLQGAAWGIDPPGTQVGRYILNYVDGGSEEVPLVLERTITDWTASASDEVPAAMSIAWDGSNESARSLGLRKRLYK